MPRSARSNSWARKAILYGHFADGTPLTVHNPGQTPACRPAAAVTLTANAEAIHLFDTETTRSLRM